MRTPSLAPALDDMRAAVLERANGVPALGAGRTLDRLCVLRDAGREDLSFARLLEGHLDATAILAEAGAAVASGALHAIWASGGPAATTRIVAGPGGPTLVGAKPFCSGVDLADVAVVCVDDEHQELAVVDLRGARCEGTVETDTSGWQTSALRDTRTGRIEFRGTPLVSGRVVAAPGWYYERAGFWQGALAPAACWAGGAQGLIDGAMPAEPRDPHCAANIGALFAEYWLLDAVLERAAAAVDRDPDDRSGAAFPRALAARHAIERSCMRVLDHFGRAFGPRPLAFDSLQARRAGELALFIRQCHAERDLAELGERDTDWLGS